MHVHVKDRLDVFPDISTWYPDQLWGTMWKRGSQKCDVQDEGQAKESRAEIEVRAVDDQMGHSFLQHAEVHTSLPPALLEVQMSH